MAASDSFVARNLAIIIGVARSEEHTSELQSRSDLVCRLLLEKKKNAACVGGADDDALVDLERHREELAARLLLEDIVVRLNAAEIVLPHPGPSFFETARAPAD